MANGISALALVFAIFSFMSVAASAQSNNWFDRWMNGERSNSTSGQSGGRRTSRDRQEERAKLDRYLRNDKELLSKETIYAMDLAIARYRKIVASGGWPSIPKQKGAWLRLGARDSRVGLLRRRLAVTGDAPRRQPDSWTVDAKLELALKRFQIRHGIRPHGVVDSRTLYALNVPAEERLAQLQVNALRLRAFVERVKDANRYVMVNVPSQELQAVRGGAVELYSKTIVGRTATQTPTVEAKIRGVNFFPFWRVPDSIARRDLIPTVLKDPEYLNREHIRVLTKWGGEEVDPQVVDWRAPPARSFKFRQDPGDHNALGLVRIDMPNEHIVYMHDTPLKKLFGRSSRTFSAGCVRVQSVIELATWLLSEDPDWNRARVDSILVSRAAQDFKLNEAVPVLFVYISAWANANGKSYFRPDIYSRDGVGAIVARYNEEPGVPQVLSP